MGRKKSPMESVPLPRIAVDLVPDLFQAVDEYCRERGMMKTEFARMAIIDMAERKGIFPLKKKTERD